MLLNCSYFNFLCNDFLSLGLKAEGSTCSHAVMTMKFFTSRGWSSFTSSPSSPSGDIYRLLFFVSRGWSTFGLSYYHPTGCHPPVGGMVRIRLICWLVLFSPCKLVTREVGDFKNPEAGVLFSPGQILLHQVTW